MSTYELYTTIEKYFNVSELQGLSSALDVDYENLGGSIKIDKCRELVTYLQRRGRLSELVECCQQLRPNLAWHKIASSIPSYPNSSRSAVIPILFLASDPTDAARLRLGEELREIQEKLQLAKLRDRFELHQRMALRAADMNQALLDVQPKIVHFSGHGTTAGDLCIEDEQGKTFPIPPDALAALFEQFTSCVDCVVLNACYTDLQANAIAQHINYVIGMSKAISDKAAIAFTIGFYQALGAGRTIEEAYRMGCVLIKLQGIPENLTPVLIRKAG